MAVFRILLADGDGRIKGDLKAVDEMLARLSAGRWFGHAGWRVAEIKRIDIGHGREPANLTGAG